MGLSWGYRAPPSRPSPVVASGPHKQPTRMSARMDGDGGTGTQAPRPVRFAVIGAGMAGLLSAIKLKEAGLTDFTVYEKADRVGGTWRGNTYPGLAWDVPSPPYPHSFAPP